MTMKRLYSPPPLFGFEALRLKPCEVEVLELDYTKGVARVIAPVDEDSIINRLRKRDGKPLLKTTIRHVPIADLSPTKPPT